MLNEFVKIRKKLQNAVVADGTVRGELRLEDGDHAGIAVLVDGGCCEEYGRRGNESVRLPNANVGDVLEIVLHPSNIKGDKYYETFERFIAGNQVEFPQFRFYIYEMDFCSDSDSLSPMPPNLERYAALMTFVKYLRSIADYCQDRDLVFIGKTALVVKVEFTKEDLPQNTESVNSLIQHLETVANREERRALFVSVLMEMLSDGMTKAQRFGYLVGHVEDIDSEYRNSHQLYIEQFSFHKVKAELDEQLLDLSEKIQSVINDAQTKLVAVPAAFVLLVTSFDFTGKGLARNLSLVVASFIFSLLIQFLLLNQFASLSFIKDAVERFKNSLGGEKATLLAGALNEAFTKVDNRRRVQRRLLIAISILVWISFVTAIGLFCYSVRVRLSGDIHVPLPNSEKLSDQPSTMRNSISA